MTTIKEDEEGENRIEQSQMMERQAVAMLSQTAAQEGCHVKLATSQHPFIVAPESYPKTSVHAQANNTEGNDAGVRMRVDSSEPIMSLQDGEDILLN